MLPSSGFFLSELLHRPILSYVILGHSFNKENSDNLVLIHLLVEISNYTRMHGEYKVKFSDAQQTTDHADTKEGGPT
jgi:hypothetical protein